VAKENCTQANLGTMTKTPAPVDRHKLADRSNTHPRQSSSTDSSADARFNARFNASAGDTLNRSFARQSDRSFNGLREREFDAAREQQSCCDQSAFRIQTQSSAGLRHRCTTVANATPNSTTVA
jgi:hypothetical protein